METKTKIKKLIDKIAIDVAMVIFKILIIFVPPVMLNNYIFGCCVEVHRGYELGAWCFIFMFVLTGWLVVLYVVLGRINYYLGYYENLD